MGGSGGGGGDHLGGGAGGGAIELIAHGTGILNLYAGSKIAVNGGDTRPDNNRGGGGVPEDPSVWWAEASSTMARLKPKGADCTPDDRQARGSARRTWAEPVGALPLKAMEPCKWEPMISAGTRPNRGTNSVTTRVSTEPWV